MKYAVKVSFTPTQIEERQAKARRLRDNLGLSTQQIAAQMGASFNAVRIFFDPSINQLGRFDHNEIVDLGRSGLFHPHFLRARYDLPVATINAILKRGYIE